ncbi:hypothetical protein [Tsukamurella soli]|uniref:hypothetical protein n=1 Tax=Tsukamurella soli TaxID=644556 RepID=UPI003623D726
MTSVTTAPDIFARILDPANRPDPYPLYSQLTGEPVHRLGPHEWLVTGFDEIGGLLRDPRMSVQDPAIEPDPDGPRGSDGKPFRAGFLSSTRRTTTPCAGRSRASSAGGSWACSLGSTRWSPSSSTGSPPTVSARWTWSSGWRTRCRWV